jgi:hypothetical protein
VTCIAAPILLADVGDHRFWVFSLDLKRGDQRIFGVHGDVVRLSFQFKPDGKLHRHASSRQYFGADVHRSPEPVGRYQRILEGVGRTVPLVKNHQVLAWVGEGDKGLAWAHRDKTAGIGNASWGGSGKQLLVRGDFKIVGVRSSRSVQRNLRAAISR